jgi:rRNA maturation protein Nop10
VVDCMRFNCLECGEKMRIISRPPQMQYKTEKKHVFTVYMKCTKCGKKAKSEQNQVMY